MKIKTLVIAATLCTLPTLSMAFGCSHSKGFQTQSCTEGAVWNPNTGSCVKISSS